MNSRVGGPLSDGKRLVDGHQRVDLALLAGMAFNLGEVALAAVFSSWIGEIHSGNSAFSLSSSRIANSNFHGSGITQQGT
ncbi:MAG TPA: hypothetical protein VFD66_12055 [Verrucomicrobiae bacterium]|nr:hypothetical protein [Verrucomicrobiae bacterium]